MPQARKYETNAERQAAYRARMKKAREALRAAETHVEQKFADKVIEADKSIESFLGGTK